MKYLTPNFLHRIYFRTSEATQVLALSCLFSGALVVCRVLYTGQLIFVFLIWNLFLAFIPYVISQRLTENPPRRKAIFLLAALAWLLCVPNAFYIITDLFHLDKNDGSVPLWYDLALLLSFAWNGLLFGILSVRQMEKLFEKHFRKNLGLLFVIPVMFLNGLGVFIGRYLRFNTWDVITNPFSLAGEILQLFIHPIRNRFDWSMIICYFSLTTLIYLAFTRLGKVLK